MDKIYWYIIIYLILIPALRKLDIKITDNPVHGHDLPEHKFVKIIKYILLAGVITFLIYFTVMIIS
jgi:hypothetical protein